MTIKRPKPVVLVILDGWGEHGADSHNAITLAKTPVWDRITAEYPSGLINASELHVGLPEGQMGNSEVGHMNIGSGRVVMQDLPKIDQAVADGALAKNPRLEAFIAALKKTGGTCHLMGLLSPGGVHAHQSHMAYLAREVSHRGVPVAVHAFTDGRDTPPQSALDYLAAFEQETQGAKLKFATVSGRYYAMDRDTRWDRVQKAYDAIVQGQGATAQNARAAVEQSYVTGKNDEFILPTVIGDYKGMKDGDGVLMANFRADRVREILAALLDPAFDGFARSRVVKIAASVGMSEYATSLNSFLATLFPPEPLTRILGEVVSEAGLKQLRIAETEKYAHVTFFFNGGREQEFPGEERILVPSPKVATYDMKPEMSAFEMTDKLTAAISEGRFDLIVVNYANTDMVGHTGDIPAAMRAVEAVDACLGKLIDATLARGGALFITADHGNAEEMFDQGTAQPHTAHTLNLVPSILIHERFRGQGLGLPEGKLADVAPTVLTLLGLPQPTEMTGRSLVPTLH